MARTCHVCRTFAHVSVHVARTCVHVAGTCVHMARTCVHVARTSGIFSACMFVSLHSHGKMICRNWDFRHQIRLFFWYTILFRVLLVYRFVIRTLAIQHLCFQLQGSKKILQFDIGSLFRLATTVVPVHVYLAWWHVCVCVHVRVCTCVCACMRVCGVAVCMPLTPNIFPLRHPRHHNDHAAPPPSAPPRPPRTLKREKYSAPMKKPPTTLVW